jgi:hypothetical protein
MFFTRMLAGLTGFKKVSPGLWGHKAGKRKYMNSQRLKRWFLDRRI